MLEGKTTGAPVGMVINNAIIVIDYAIRHGNMKRIPAENGLDTSIEQGVGPKLKTGDLVVMPTVGAGYLTGCISFVHEDFLG